MPVYRLSRRLVFPPVEEAEAGGLLAVGGDLNPGRLLLAYGSGIFPWYEKGEPLLWWSPDPRFVLHPAKLRVSQSMRRLLAKGTFQVTFDQKFRTVMERCARVPRHGQDGTWITRDMVAAYLRLHEAGFAHSVEVWSGGQLAGGLYGVSLGACFCGESMYADAANASKYGLIVLVRLLQKRGLQFIDCQTPTPHLASLGGESEPRPAFIERLERALREPTLRGNWGDLLGPDLPALAMPAPVPPVVRWLR